MRAMWNGNVTFGLVHIPVRLYAATEDRDVRFHQVHLADGGRIKYQRQCQTCNKVVSFAEIGKGFEDEGGRRVIISDEELDELVVPHSKDIEIVEFVPSDQIDPLNFEKAYYLEPGTGAAKPYVLLRRALEQTDRMALVTMSLRKRTRLGLLRIRGDVLVLQTLLWPDEVRTAEFPGITDEDVSVRPQELTMAGSLVESLAGDFDPSQYRDDYREGVLDLLERKLNGEEVIVPEPEVASDETGKVVDLMAALQESVRRSKAAKAASGGADADDDETDQDEPATPTAAKRATAKKATAAKKAAAKKSAAKKTSTPARKTGT